MELHLFQNQESIIERLRRSGLFGTEHPNDPAADIVTSYSLVGQKLHRHVFRFTHDSEQDMLGADVVMTKRNSLTQRQFMHLLLTRSKRDLAYNYLAIFTDLILDPISQIPNRDLKG